jgi:putative transposase
MKGTRKNRAKKPRLPVVMYKYRLYPTKTQSEFLLGQLREACDLYNDSLQERIGAWRTCRKSLNFYDQDNQLKAMRAEGLIRLANYSCCQDVLWRVHETFSAFFARLKRGEKPGFPRFKPSRRYDSIRFTYGDGSKLTGSLLRIQGAGEIKVKLHRPVEGVIKTATIKRQAGHWFVCLSVECEPDPLPVITAEIGIDLGLTSFATLSSGAEIENPRYYRKAQMRLRVAQRRVARRKKGSNRRRKAIRELQKMCLHIANQRRDFHHKESRKLVNGYGIIAVEDLNVKGLTRGIHRKSVHDAGWSAFINMLAYKAESAGRKLIKVDPRGTSQTCICGAAVRKTLADRWHRCPACGLSAGRDHVSAQIILARIEPSRLNVEVSNSCVPREAVAFQATE